MTRRSARFDRVRKNVRPPVQTDQRRISAIADGLDLRPAFEDQPARPARIGNIEKFDLRGPFITRPLRRKSPGLHGSPPWVLPSRTSHFCWSPTHMVPSTLPHPPT